MWKRLSMTVGRMSRVPFTRLPSLRGMRKRRVHDLRRTAITLYRDAGADKVILRRCTHQPARDVLEQYTTFEWGRLCAQIQPLKIQRRVA